ncbi:glutathione transferase GST 23-like [Cucumis melo var. makuwa]|uniref:glutathione transferase n=1 Tax=Cucumis melo var. makuwa TaxID=1194695 RepID=A0A5D3CZI9_CUCMM|nr:glutathione transferase GST 23-like [Cucumis melo var. makuwa]
MEEVKLHGMWASPFVCRVKWGLELKGIPYEYVEEDISNKSPSLLHYNPLYKKVPVLVHGAKPVCESIIILEYIDEIWPQYPLFPIDPFDRATTRFWIKYADNKLFGSQLLFGSRSREEEEKAKAEAIEFLRTIEEQCLGDKKFFAGEEIGALDLAFGGIAHWLPVLEQITGKILLDADEFPRLYAWTQNFKEAAVIRDNLPDAQKLAGLYNALRDKQLQSAAQ